MMSAWNRPSCKANIESNARPDRLQSLAKPRYQYHLHTMVISNRKLPRGLIPHSDRDSQYCSHDYQKLLTLHGEKFATRAIARNHVFEYIEIYNNRKRLHSMIGYKSPELFEAKMVA